MEPRNFILSLQASGFTKQPRFYKFVMDDSTNNCDKCLRYAGQVFIENDFTIPSLPLHPNCDCSFIEVDQKEYLKQKYFEFGAIKPDQWAEQTEEEKYLWCNSFRSRFGNAIDKYAKQYNIPKQLIAGVIANEMLDWKFPDGTWLDGLTGGGIGYAQIALSTARKYGVKGSIFHIIKKLNTYEGSVEITAVILKNYFDEFRNSIKNDKLGPGFQKSILYYMPKPHILLRDDFVNMKVPEWVLNPICAVWNSGIGVIYAKDKLGDKNYSNAFKHGLNSSSLLPYLPKLVNE